jgi:predicted AlkP superfamily phosphohydrolase/phosphomutase
LSGGIRLNIAGRETHGVIAPHEVESVVAQLTAELLQLRDGRSGAPIVNEVLRSSDLDLQGWDGDFPDLVVNWAQASLSWIESPKVGRLEPYLVRRRSGDHDASMMGLFFAAAPQITAGRLAAVRLVDFAPTVSRLAGITLGDSDGQPIAGLAAPAAL